MKTHLLFLSLFLLTQSAFAAANSCDMSLSEISLREMVFVHGQYATVTKMKSGGRYWIEIGGQEPREVRREDISVTRGGDGRVRVGAHVYFERNFANVLAVAPNGTFTIRYPSRDITQTQQIRSGIPGNTLAVPYGGYVGIKLRYANDPNSRVVGIDGNGNYTVETSRNGARFYGITEQMILEIIHP